MNNSTIYDSANIVNIINTISHRPEWNEYFMGVAYLISKRSSCERLHVGCVLVHDNRIIATGYNGHLAGTQHISYVRDGHEMMTVHAETNAVTDASKRGVTTMGCTAYITHMPCINCVKVLLSAGIKKIVIGEYYKNDPLVLALCNSCDVDIYIYTNKKENIITDL